MAIKSNIGIPLIELTASGADTVLEPPAGIRQVVTAFSLHNKSVLTKAVTITDTGVEVAKYSIEPGESVDVVEVIGQGYGDAEDIKAQQTTGGASADDINAKLTITQYDGDSV